MKNLIQFLVLAIATLTITACTPPDEAPENLQGSWSLTWIKDFTVDIPNAGILGNLCTPGSTVELNFAGVAKARFSGNRSATNENMYIRMGDRANNSAPPATLANNSFYIDCNDITVSSIEHRDVYVTGQPGYITKQIIDGKCVLKSERARTRPKYSVFIKLTGSQSAVNSQGQTIYDDTNRLAGITYDCDDGRLESTYRTANTNKAERMEVPSINMPDTLKKLKSYPSSLNNPSILK